MVKQVDKSHYQFHRYMSKPRWMSVWHQIDEVLRLEPREVLEIGPGLGIFKAIVCALGAKVETLDMDPELGPDHVGTVMNMPILAGSFDLVCAFQVLEHLPYESALDAFREMVRVSRKHIVISLPDARRMWRYQLHLPGFGEFSFLIPRMQLMRPFHVFDGEHHWEINKRGFEIGRIIRDFSSIASLEKEYRVKENPYHRFFVFRRRD